MTSRFNLRLLQPLTRAALAEELARIESDPSALERALAKADWLLLRADALPSHDAMIIKQLLISYGGDAIITPAAYLNQPGAAQTPALLFGSRRAMRSLVTALRAMPLDELRALAGEIEALLALPAHDRGELKLATTSLAWGQRTYVMGIINMTPDSFSQDGLLQQADPLAALADQARRFEQDGADLLDLGAESSRPGAAPVGVEQELERLLPALGALRSASALPISVDTYKAPVAAQALAAGADLLNDIWGLRTPEGGWNEPLARLVAERQVPIVLMHNRRAQAASGQLVGHYQAVQYQDLLAEICAELRESVAYAEAHGIARQRIVVDPGIGFGKTPAQNIELLSRLGELRSLGLPILLGTSRKSFIGLALGLPPEQRQAGTLVTSALGIAAGADILRVHDVRENVQAARMADAMLRSP